MTILSKIKYRFKELLSEIYAVRSHKNNQQSVHTLSQTKIK